jgi:CheY-like chemotaxis protein
MPHILIVDDDRAIRSLFRTLFASEGYTVSAAANGREALQVLAAIRPDLIMTDLHMPEMDGIALCWSVHDQPAIAMIPVIVCTAHTYDQRIHTCPWTALLVKPCALSIMVDTVTAVLTLDPAHA